MSDTEYAEYGPPTDLVIWRTRSKFGNTTAGTMSPGTLKWKLKPNPKSSINPKFTHIPEETGNLERVAELEAAQEELRKNKKWLRSNPQADDLNEAAKKWDVL